MNRIALLCATSMLVVPSAVWAQSTGTRVFENPDVVVTARTGPDTVGGVSNPDTAKARGDLDQEFIGRQRPGQTIEDTLNYLPGVSFQNNGPYGDAGGTLTIHGFDDSRISQTFNGIPTNDSGNYALYAQEQLDPELIEHVTVSLGSTDIDSPTASATGSTINYVTRDPSKDFHARLAGSVGQWSFLRIFGVVDTGALTGLGTRAFVAASTQSDVDPYNPRARLNKVQLNAKLYQPIGSGDDFVSAAVFHNINRGNRFGDVLLRNDRTVTGVGAPSGFPSVADLRDYTVPPCLTTTPTPRVADKANTCGTVYDYGYNPSNTTRYYANSRFTLAKGLTLTVDPYLSYTEANGGSAVAATEGTYSLKVGTATRAIYGFIGGKPYFGGVDLNGDGDTLDTVEVSAPTNTITHRYGVIANLIYRFSPTQSVRVNYTLDHAKLRQTGESGLLEANGFARDYFPREANPLRDASGNPIQKRDRLSLSILNQVSGEYRGQFFDRRLTIEAGLRAPFFKRDLTNNCVSESGGNGYVDCFNDPTAQAAFLTANPTYQPPQARNFSYNKLLPSAGFTFKVTPAASLFFDYSEGLQVPSTDDLYDAFAFAAGSPSARPVPETTQNLEGGLRYRSRHLIGEVSGWYTDYHDKIERAYDPIQDITVYRNIGRVKKYGVDASIGYAPVRQLTFYAFGSYLRSKIVDNIQTGNCTANNVKFGDTAGVGICTTVGQNIYALTAGKREGGAPTFTYGGRTMASLGPLDVGLQAKRTGPRYVNDQNTPLYSGTTVIFPAKAPAYTLVDVDARLRLGFLGLKDTTYFQLNVTNLLDKFYVGGFGGNISNTFVPYAYIGTPRTVSGTLNVAF